MCWKASPPSSQRRHHKLYLAVTWLESSRRLIIHIEDNGVPLLYSGSWSPLTDRNLLIERTREMALAQHIDPSVRPVSSSLLRSPVYTVEGSRKDSYLGCVLVLPVGNSFQSLTLLAYKGPASSGLYRDRFVPPSQPGWNRGTCVSELDTGG